MTIDLQCHVTIHRFVSAYMLHAVHTNELSQKLCQQFHVLLMSAQQHGIRIIGDGGFSTIYHQCGS